MKTATFYLLAILFFSSCKKYEERIYHPEVEPLIYEFVIDGHKYNKNVKLKKLKSVILQGEFKQYPGWSGYAYNGIVYLDTTSFKYKFAKKFLVYHELGHALLGRGDNDVTHPSIMNGLPPDWDYNQEYYIKELFTYYKN
jgi:hypothetical protein